MTFLEFRDLVANHFYDMVKDVDHLFVVHLDKDELWNLYLDSFPAGTNVIYIERREHDCQSCKSFIRRLGNVVAIKENKIHTIWEVECDDPAYGPVLKALDAFVRAHQISDVFMTHEKLIGIPENHSGGAKGVELRTWHHLAIDLPDKFVANRRVDLNEEKSTLRDTRNVFKRSLEEFSEDSIMTVLELIGQNNLYRGDQWRDTLWKFLDSKREYDQLNSEEEKSNYAWVKGMIIGQAAGRIRNHSIGQLLIDISRGVDLETAVSSYERITAPSNYKRPKAIYTKKMLDEARRTVESLGYLESLQRRFANIDDVSVNNILFSNKDVQDRITQPGNVFDEMEKEVAVNPKKFSHAEEIGIEDFVKDVLPSATEISALVENRHSKNMVSLITGVDPDAKSMFPWDNPVSWAYTGNITDSDIRENVKAAGGKVDGVMRFSIQWNDGEEWDENDLDAHCIEPSGEEIFFQHMKSRITRGELDIDIIDPIRGKAAVENIIYPTKDYLIKGNYIFYVHNYTFRGGRSGFRAEIECDGVIHKYDYRQMVKQNETVKVAVVHFDGESFTIGDCIKSDISVREVWGIKTNQFTPVSMICYSPNYWNEQKGIGHKHYFFMLKDCVNKEKPNGFFNEYLKHELVKNNKRVFEMLGSKTHVMDTDDQLSGIGFSSTKREDLILKVTNDGKDRILKVKF